MLINETILQIVLKDKPLFKNALSKKKGGRGRGRERGSGG